MLRKISWAVVSIAGAVLIIVALRTVVAASDRSSTESANTAPVSAETAETQPPSPLKISAANLYKAYNLNGVAANDEYSGRKLEVSGVVSGRNGVRGTGVHLHLRVDQDGLETVEVVLRAEQDLAASQRRNGDAVTVECDHVQRNLGSVTLSNCRVASGESISTGE